MPILSMTGFGAATFDVDGQTYRVEIKAVNHRNLNARFRMPPEFSSAETHAMKAVKASLVRGSAEISVHRGSAGPVPVEVHVDEAGARAFMTTLQRLADSLDAPRPGLEVLVRYGEFIEVRKQEASPEMAAEGLLTGVAAALAKLREMRAGEGAALATDMRQRIDNLGGLLAVIETRAPEVYEAYEQRLRQRMSDAEQATGLTLDQGKVATELVAFADRSDVTEEIVRARTHLARFGEILAEGADETGKRLDFLMQELLREFNTVGSKCRDAGIAHEVVSAKVELEKIREQVQNIA